MNDTREGMNDTREGMTIGVGVAAYGHDDHLARTLEALDEALREAGIEPEARIVAVGDGSPRAEKIASEHGWSARRTLTGSPKTRAAAREAARRAAGGDLCLLVDGDVAVATGWLRPAVALFEGNPALVGVTGVVDEAHWRAGAMVGGARDVDRIGAGGAVKRIRDVALWRRAPVDEAGGYDVWLPGEDDAELVARLALTGLRIEALPTKVGVRHGSGRWSFGGWREALRTGDLAGKGMALRRSGRSLVFGAMLSRSVAAILLFLWVVLGAVLAIVTLAGGPFVVWIWATVGLLAFFAVLRWSLRRAFFGGLTQLAQGAFVVRQTLVPFGRSRLGTPPRPLAPAREPKGASASGSERLEDPHPFERPSAMPRDPDEPPPLVSGR